MTRTSNLALRALDRWVEKGLLPPELAGILRAEMEEELRGESSRWVQFALAATGGAILLIAGATFLAWAWPEMGYGGQAGALGIIGAMVVVPGIRLLGSPRLVPVAYLLQLSGPFLLASCLALLIAACYYGAEKAGALGAVLALTGMAVVLFWASSRLGPGKVKRIEEAS